MRKMQMLFLTLHAIMILIFAAKMIGDAYVGNRAGMTDNMLMVIIHAILFSIWHETDFKK